MFANEFATDGLCTNSEERRATDQFRTAEPLFEDVVGWTFYVII